MRLLFACGASYEDVKEAPEFSHRRKDGAGRLLVYDSDGGITRPNLDGKDAPCRNETKGRIALLRAKQPLATAGNRWQPLAPGGANVATGSMGTVLRMRQCEASRRHPMASAIAGTEATRSMLYVQQMVEGEAVQSAMKIGKYMTARAMGLTPEAYDILSSRGDALGTVDWYQRWRQYVFNPEVGAVFSADCLRDLATFLESKVTQP